ncbi:MAG: hypothetical protein JO287_12425 [Pseudonocardiales bacterium]|nr:hypothetical protein [Pseudonocardiales bacterium]
MTASMPGVDIEGLAGIGRHTPDVARAGTATSNAGPEDSTRPRVAIRRDEPLVA